METNEFGHTPGPWLANLSTDKREFGYIREVVKTPDGRQVAVAQVLLSGRPISEVRTNARLIEAAPEMLIFIRDWLNDFVAAGATDSPHEARARELIARVGTPK